MKPCHIWSWGLWNPKCKGASCRPEKLRISGWNMPTHWWKNNRFSQQNLGSSTVQKTCPDKQETMLKCKWVCGNLDGPVHNFPYFPITTTRNIYGIYGHFPRLPGLIAAVTCFEQHLQHLCFSSAHRMPHGGRHRLLSISPEAKQMILGISKRLEKKKKSLMNGYSRYNRWT